jgi:Animal haem peroxidase
MKATGTKQAPAPYVIPGRHGEVRGMNLTPQSSMFEGRFGRLFRTLPAAEFNETDLEKLGKAMTAPADVTSADEVDPEENSAISAGYTYLGQFIDHDLTFDPASSLQQQNDPDALVDFRTPRFDLDCVYGRGPDDQPYLYRGDGLHMLLGDVLTGFTDDPKARSVPRNTPEPKTKEPARALIGDKRNDENVIVSQLQSAFLRFHNRVVDFLSQGDGQPTFEEAQRTVRWHYQWVVLYDFLPTIIGQDTLHRLLPHTAKNTNILKDPPVLRFYHPKKDAFMPIEFSAAAYRFGHSMVRPSYRLNDGSGDRPIFPDLVGFEAFATNLAIDWGKFFDFGDGRPKTGPKRLLPAYKIDTSLVNPLGHLPPSVATNPPSLAERNLKRGWRMGLPSGQMVAEIMGEEPIDDKDLKVGKATEEDFGAAVPLTKISADFTDNAPLWYYVLAEAQQQFAKKPKDDTPLHLGPVGGRIVGETFIGLMLADGHSFLRQNPLWQPFDEFGGKKFKMADLLREARKV